VCTSGVKPYAPPQSQSIRASAVEAATVLGYALPYH
jgi:hypothetical protein